MMHVFPAAVKLKCHGGGGFINSIFHTLDSELRQGNKHLCFKNVLQCNRYKSSSLHFNIDIAGYPQKSHLCKILIEIYYFYEDSENE